MEQLIFPFLLGMGIAYLIFTILRIMTNNRHMLPSIVIDIGVALSIMFVLTGTFELVIFLAGFVGALLARFIIRIITKK